LTYAMRLLGEHCLARDFISDAVGRTQFQLELPLDTHMLSAAP